MKLNTRGNSACIPQACCVFYRVQAQSTRFSAWLSSPDSHQHQAATAPDCMPVTFPNSGTTKVVSLDAVKKRQYRQKVRMDPEKYDRVKSRDAERKRMLRMQQSQEQKETEKLKARDRARKYRERTRVQKVMVIDEHWQEAAGVSLLQWPQGPMHLQSSVKPAGVGSWELRQPPLAMRLPQTPDLSDLETCPEVKAEPVNNFSCGRKVEIVATQLPALYPMCSPGQPTDTHDKEQMPQPVVQGYFQNVSVKTPNQLLEGRDASRLTPEMPL